MKTIFFLLFSLCSLSLYSQSDILNMVYDINDLPERILGYHKIVVYKYEIGYGEEANIDTTIIDKDGSILSLMLKSKSITEYGEAKDINYHISMNTGDTLVSTTEYDDLNRAIFQKYEYGDSNAAKVFNSNRALSYDDHGRVTSIIKTDMNNEQKGYIRISYDEDNLPLTINSNLGIGELQVVREEKEDHIRYNITPLMSQKFTDLMLEMGKESKPMPLVYVELRKSDELFESKFFKQNEKDSITLQSMTKRDILGNIHEKIEYIDQIKINHKQFAYHKERLLEVYDVLNKNNFKIEFDENRNPLTEYNEGSTATMKYNDDGILFTKSISRIYHDGITEYEVRRYYK